MLRITISLLLVLSHQSILAQTTELARARQAYHTQRELNPTLAPSISDLLDSLHLRREFSAFCPIDGSPALLLRNEGLAETLTPPTSQLHPWEPAGWVQTSETGGWKARCPGDSITFNYYPSSSRANCAPEPDLPPWSSSSPNSPNIWWIEVETPMGLVSGSVYPRLGADQVFDKPVIVVEGFDFGTGGNLEEHRHGNFGWQSLFACDLEIFPGTYGYPILIDTLYSLGYDIVFVDFQNGTQSIEHKSELVKKTIELCNIHKLSEKSLVVVGASMGGIVARHAICSMEQNSEEHCTRLYVSIDAPHRGANISPGLFGLVSLLAVLSSEASIFYEGLNSPAAQQLLISTPNGESTYNEAMALLEELGMPLKSVNISIANSHPSIPINLDNGPLLNWTDYWWWLGTAHLLANRHPNGNNNLAISASCALPVDFIPFNGVGIWYEDERYSYYTETDMDIAPSSIGHHMGQLVDAINASGMICIASEDYQPDCGFIPTSSALNCDLISEEDPSFDFVSYAPEWSSPQEHVALTQLHRKLILDHIILGDIIAPEFLGTSFPQSYYAYSHLSPIRNWIGRLEISQGGVLQLGESENSLVERISVRTLPCDTEIDVNTGAKLSIGTTSGLAPAVLHLEDGSKLTGHQGGEIIICLDSELRVKSGSKFVLDGTNLNILQEGKLVIETGGVLELHNNANVILEGGTSVIQLEGKIVVFPESHSTISTTGESTSTIFISGSDSNIYISNNGELLISGNTEIELGINSSFDVLGGGTFKTNNTTIHMPSGSFVNQSCQTNLSNTFIYGSLNSEWRGSNRIRIEDSKWQRVRLSIEHLTQNNESMGLISHNTEIIESDWELTNTGFQVMTCEFIASTLKSTDHVGPSHFSRNRIEGAYGISEAIIDITGGDNLNMAENTFTEGEKAISFESVIATLNCNSFYGWDTALEFKGKNSISMNPDFGGGYNRFSSNRVHMKLICSTVPFMSDGMNSFGTYGTYCLEGEIKWSCDDPWVIEGNNWINSNIASNITSCEDGCQGSNVEVILVLPSDVVVPCSNSTMTNDEGKSLGIEAKFIDMFGREIDLDKTLNNNIISPGIYLELKKDGRVKKHLLLE
jgi:hypothetical protein